MIVMHLEGCSKDDRLVLWKLLFFIRIKMFAQCSNKPGFSVMLF